MCKCRCPVYYKNVQIGKVSKVDLSSDGSKVIVDCLIDDKYKKFIRKKFWIYDISGFEMKFSIFLVQNWIKYIYKYIKSCGIVVVTPYEYNEIASSKDKFILNKH